MTARLVIWIIVLAACCAGAYFLMVHMPGASHRGPLPPLTDGELAIRGELRLHVGELAGKIGERNVFRPEALALSAAYIENAFGTFGYEVQRQSYTVHGLPCHNLIVEIGGRSRPDEIVVVGAHYDSVAGSPGANDNASGVAALLVLARRFANRVPERTLRLVAFVNEEPPFFMTSRMGSLVYARAIRERGDRVAAMLSLETIGYYRDDQGSQRYPPPLRFFYPSTGDFIAVVGNVRSRALTRRAIRVFRKTTDFPSEGAALPGFVPGVGWSDHWSFWKQGWPAIMFTDTAPYRYPHYHSAHDVPDGIDFDRTARVVGGIERVVENLVGWPRDTEAAPENCGACP